MIIVADQVSLTVRRQIPIPKYVNALAFDATGDRLFASVLREEEGGGVSYRLVTVDPYSGEILSDLQGGAGMGLSRCAGNPTAHSDRWIVFACDGASILDAVTGVPMAILEGAVYGVAPGNEDDVFYLAYSDGTVEKIEIIE